MGGAGFVAAHLRMLLPWQLLNIAERQISGRDEPLRDSILRQRLLEASLLRDEPLHLPRAICYATFRGESLCETSLRSCER